MDEVQVSETARAQLGEALKSADAGDLPRALELASGACRQRPQWGEAWVIHNWRRGETQHRPKPLGFADFGGNRQYITLGNLTENNQAFIFLMDYANRQRVKLWGTARVVEDDPDLLERLRDPAYPGTAQRAILFTVEAWDVNCSQNIHRRFVQRQAAAATEQLQQRIAELESELKRLKEHHEVRRSVSRDE